jgi:4-alpha-glucanotransferase
MRPQPPLGRSAGLVIPLFSLHSARGAGIGDIGDLAALAPWLREAGLSALQLLPVGPLPAGETSPYSALSAMAIDPLYIDLDQVSDFQAIGGEARLPLADQIALRTARAQPRVDYAGVRQGKESALRLAFSLFWDVDWLRTTARAGAFAAFVSWEEWWVADYGLYCALREQQGNRPWRDWPDTLRDRQPAAIEQARHDLEREIFYHQYVQWIADEQWERARTGMGEIRLFGDFPFMVSADSADVWANQDAFRFDRTIGTPPDAFSATGQDWGLPVYRWDVMERADYRWLRQRARRMASLYDGYRVDHLVGFYRTYSRGLGETLGTFDPEDEPAQRAQGERILTMLVESGAQVTAEDLGLIPDFVRASLANLGVPGYKVLRWERAWHSPGQPLLDPSTFSPVSVTTTSTHDIDPLALWWETLEPRERSEMLSAVGLPARVDAAFDDRVRDGLLAQAYRSGSNLLLLPIQDVFGWRDRVNVPATVTADNWSWKLPLSVEGLKADAAAQERAAAVRKLAIESGRIPGTS